VVNTDRRLNFSQMEHVYWKSDLVNFHLDNKIDFRLYVDTVIHSPELTVSYITTTKPRPCSHYFNIKFKK
jgi:hypothetical protein